MLVWDAIAPVLFSKSTNRAQFSQNNKKKHILVVISIGARVITIFNLFEFQEAQPQHTYTIANSEKSLWFYEEIEDRFCFFPTVLVYSLHKLCRCFKHHIYIQVKPSPIYVNFISSLLIPSIAFIFSILS